MTSSTPSRGDETPPRYSYFLWFITDDTQLPVVHDRAIKDPSNEIYLSIASVWEAVIKDALGKLPLSGPAFVFLPEERIKHGIAP